LINKLRNDEWNEQQFSVKEFEESENIHLSTEILPNEGLEGPSLKNQLSQFYPGTFYTDFDVKKDPVFNIHDYSWSEQGYALVRRYYSKANLLDEEFNYIQEFSYKNFNTQQDVDTGPFRKSIWRYIHRIYGILHDDFDYRYLNICLNKKFKTLIKKLNCYPQVLRKQDIDFGLVLMPSEKVHIMIIACEARKQAELLYGLKALVKYQKTL